jgi:hypothetical protein
METKCSLETKVLSVSEKIIEDLVDGISFQDFTVRLKKELDLLGVDLLKVVQESNDQKLYGGTKEAGGDDKEGK